MHKWIKGNEIVSELANLKLSEEILIQLDLEKETTVKVGEGEGEYYQLTLTDEFKRYYNKPVIITPLVKINFWNE